MIGNARYDRISSVRNRATVSVQMEEHSFNVRVIALNAPGDAIKFRALTKRQAKSGTQSLICRLTFTIHFTSWLCIHSKMTASNAASVRTALCLSDMSRLTRCPRCLAPRGLRFSSTDSEAPPPLLSKIRNDLKTAMKAKDQSRYDCPLRPNWDSYAAAC
jgi:hypothetical protein